ncbi:MAG: hypothetical protein PHY92_03690 [Alphaproteobacteria bacterium]|nr:hypothetical protein [Alphaproteobacteria bacterium]
MNDEADILKLLSGALDAKDHEEIGRLYAQLVKLAKDHVHLREPLVGVAGLLLNDKEGLYPLKMVLEGLSAVVRHEPRGSDLQQVAIAYAVPFLLKLPGEELDFALALAANALNDIQTRHPMKKIAEENFLKLLDARAALDIEGVLDFFMEHTTTRKDGGSDHGLFNADPGGSLSLLARPRLDEYVDRFAEEKGRQAALEFVGKLKLRTRARKGEIVFKGASSLYDMAAVTLGDKSREPWNMLCHRIEARLGDTRVSTLATTKNFLERHCRHLKAG